jgi:hypothetical protein
VRDGRIITFWAVTVAVLFVVEVAELTHLFTLPFLSAVGNLVSFIFALVFTTILALVGALFIGIYISQRYHTGAGFTAFEEEMLKMRAEVQRIAEDVSELRRQQGGPRSGDPPSERTERP